MRSETYPPLPEKVIDDHSDPRASALAGRRALFISYNGMLDPLGQSQVLPYLRQLARRGVIFTLMSFERADAFSATGRAKSETLQAQLKAENIEWHWLRYHQRPSLPATAYDVLAGILLGQRLVRQNKIEVVHARSHIPATIALALKRRFGIKMIFDIRGLMAEEYVDAAHWRKGSIPYRLTKTMERRAMAAADGVVTLTERIWPVIRNWEGLAGRSIVHEVVPCCADLERFEFNAADRAMRRAELGIENRFVVIYSGSIDGWYLTEQMADFFALFLRRLPKAHFLWLTTGSHTRVSSLMEARGIGPKDYSVLSVASSEVPSYLSAGDAGLAFIKPCFSKLASSPTKYAEYLACELPLIINAGIGDSDVLITTENIGALVEDFSEDQYDKAFETVMRLASSSELTRKRARQVAESLFNLETIAAPRYERLYQRVLKGQDQLSR